MQSFLVGSEVSALFGFSVDPWIGDLSPGLGVRVIVDVLSHDVDDCWYERCHDLAAVTDLIATKTAWVGCATVEYLVAQSIETVKHDR